MGGDLSFYKMLPHAPRIWCSEPLVQSPDAFTGILEQDIIPDKANRALYD